MSFLENSFFYFIILIITVSYPLLRSFEPKIHFYNNWKSLLVSILYMMLIFIPWDIAFTYKNIWHFNPNYVIGLYVFSLPIEEWLFFVIIPFSCVFIHEVVNYFFPLRNGFTYIKSFTLISSFVFYVIAIFYYKQTYTFVCFFFNATLLLFLLIKKNKWLSEAFRTYLFTLIPFLFINGLLTGSFTSEPVVIYNDNAIINFRIMNIPIEDFFYNLSLILVTLKFYKPNI